VKQKEIWLIRLDSPAGAEMGKVRPCVIVSSNLVGILPLKVIAPLTDYKEKYDAVPWMVKIAPTHTNGLEKISAIDVFQVRSVSKERLIRKIGDITDSDMKNVSEALKPIFAC
jgi:mRNA interferase MazF